jgi:hypothetical protein
MDLPTGVVSDKIHDAPRFSISGHACDRKSAFAALLSDDTSRWHLAAVGDDAFLGRVEADFARLPAATRDQLHLQLYRPGDWEVGQFGLPASGLVLRKPAAGRQSGDVGQVPAADYSAEKLDEVLCKPSGPTPRPVPAPAPRPVDPVDPDQPAPGPAPEPAPNPVVPPWTLAAALFAILLLLRRK